MLDWNELRFFLAVCRDGSFAAAARVLKVDETTVSRRIARLEASLGARLFGRTPDGLSLTAAGESVLDDKLLRELDDCDKLVALRIAMLDVLDDMEQTHADENPEGSAVAFDREASLKDADARAAGLRLAMQGELVIGD